jgi:AcrR family transcriptional regulator
MVKPVKKRTYESPVRQEQAAQTRARVVQTAAELFEAKGYARTTIKQIADGADVAIDTVYATFGSKPRVLTAVIDDRLGGGAPVGNVMERPEALAVRDETDQRRQIDLLAHDLANVVTRVGPVFEMLRSAASVEPQLAKIHAEMQTYRAANMARAIEWLLARGPLRVSPERAVDTLWTIAAPDVARMLFELRGWSTEDYAEWLSDTLARVLLPDG